MDKEKLDLLSKEYLLKIFIINFVPGLILYSGLDELIDVYAGDGFLSLIIICSFAWTLGLIQEIIFFNDYYKVKRNNSKELDLSFQHNLLIAKVGSAVVIACLIGLFTIIIDVVDSKVLNEGDQLPRLFLKTSVLMFIGVFLVVKFRNKLKKSVNTYHEV